MDSLSFKDLSNSILNLFEKGENKHNCINVLGKNVGTMEFHERLFNSFIGDIDDFYSWAKPKLEEFFQTFNKNYLLSPDERINRRRYYEYEVIVKSKTFKQTSFKKKMMKSLKLDIASCLQDGEYSGEYTDTEEHRRILFLNFIKTYVRRLFLIDIIWVCPKF